MQTYLGIDYGRTHVGLALAKTPLSEPLETVALSQSIQRITELIQEFLVDALVIGVSEGSMAEETREFAVKLQEEVHIPITFHDETLTSQDAQKAIRHKKQSKRQGPDHHYAAALILQDYLDTLDASI